MHTYLFTYLQILMNVNHHWLHVNTNVPTIMEVFNALVMLDMSWQITNEPVMVCMLIACFVHYVLPTYVLSQYVTQFARRYLFHTFYMLVIKET